jgi:hypothetical protein
MRSLLQTAKTLFRRLSVREKALTLLFLAVLAAIWASSLLGRIADWRDERRQVRLDLLEQSQWLAHRDDIAAELARALERVDPARTYSSTQLSGRIDALVREVQLAADIDPVRTREGEIFNDHHLRVRLSRVSLAKLIEFNNLLAQESPYINLERLRISANKRNPEELDARYEINSFDLKPGAIQN